MICLENPNFRIIHFYHKIVEYVNTTHTQLDKATIKKKKKKKKQAKKFTIL